MESFSSLLSFAGNCDFSILPVTRITYLVHDILVVDGHAFKFFKFDMS